MADRGSTRFEAVRKALVTTEWTIPGDSCEESDEGSQLLLTMVMAGVSHPVEVPPLRLFHGLPPSELPQYSDTFFALVLWAVACVTGADTVQAERSHIPTRGAHMDPTERFCDAYGVHGDARATGPMPLSAKSTAALAEALALMPGATDVLWRRPALLAALEALSSFIWDCQGAVHAAEAEVAPAVLCPLCAAVAVGNELAVEALCSLLHYHRLLSDSASSTDGDLVERHMEALRRNAVWNGQRRIAARLTAVWYPRLMRCQADNDGGAEDSQGTAASHALHRLVRSVCLYVQDASMVARSEAEMRASLATLAALCSTPSERQCLTHWCVAVPLLWLRDDEAPNTPPLTLLAWFVKRGFDRAARDVLNGLVNSVDPSLATRLQSSSSAVGAGRRVVDLPTAAETQGDEDGDVVGGGTALRVDFAQLATAVPSRTAADAAVSSATERQTAHGSVDNKLSDVLSSVFVSRAHQSLLLLHSASVLTAAAATTTSASGTEGDHVTGGIGSQSALDAAVRGGDGPMVRLLLTVGASSASVHPSVLEVALQPAEEACALDASQPPASDPPTNGRRDMSFLRLLRCPALQEANAMKASSFLDQIRGCLYTSSKSALLASLAAKLWQQKVAALSAPSALHLCEAGDETSRITSEWRSYFLAHDRVLRPALAALELDPFEPLARLTLIDVLSRKLRDVLPLLPVLWEACDGQKGGDGVGEADVARHWLTYYGAVRHVLATLTETLVGRQVLTRALQSRRLLRQHATQTRAARARQQLDARGSNVDALTVADPGKHSDGEAEIDSQLFRTVTAEARAVLIAIDRVTAKERHGLRVPSGPSSASTSTVSVKQDADGHCLVSVYCSPAFLASVAAGAGAFLRRRPHDMDTSVGVMELGAHVWLQVPSVINLGHSLARAGGCVGMVVHHMPLDAPFEQGDLVLFVNRRIEGDAQMAASEPVAARLEAVQHISWCHRRHPRVLQVPCVLRQPTTDAADGVVTLQLIAAGQGATCTAASSSTIDGDTQGTPISWLDARHAAQLQATEASRKMSGFVPVDVMWSMRASPELTRRWGRTALIANEPLWLYNEPNRMDAERKRLSRAWGTWCACEGRCRPLLDDRHQLAWPLMHVTPTQLPLVYVLEGPDGSTGEASALSLRVVGVLPECVSGTA